MAKLLEGTAKRITVLCGLAIFGMFQLLEIFKQVNENKEVKQSERFTAEVHWTCKNMHVIMFHYSELLDQYNKSLKVQRYVYNTNLQGGGLKKGTPNGNDINESI